MNDSARIRRITRVSRIARAALALGAILTITSWVAPLLVESRELSFSIGPLSLTWRVWSQGPSLHSALADIGGSPFVFLVMPRILIFGAVVHQAMQLFGLYQRGLIFTVHHVLCLRRIGVLLALWGLISLVYPALLGSLARILADGYQGYWFSANWDALFYMLGGVGVVVLAWVMHEGLQLSAEQELTI
jgi:hypothetical protein